MSPEFATETEYQVRSICWQVAAVTVVVAGINVLGYFHLGVGDAEGGGDGLGWGLGKNYYPLIFYESGGVKFLYELNRPTYNKFI